MPASKRAEHAADAVHREHVERVVDLQHALHEAGRDEADDAGASRRSPARRRARRKPDAGVIVARPATMPVTMPSTLGLPYRNHSIAIHASAPAAAEMCVTSIAMPALPLAASARAGVEPEPAHPQHAGAGHGHRHVVRRHRRAAESRALTQRHRAQPAPQCRRWCARRCRRRKSSRPFLNSQPSGAHTQWQTGT